MQDLLAVALLVGIALLFFWPIFTGRVPIPRRLLPFTPPWGGLLTNGPPVVRNPVGSDTLWQVYPYAHFRHWVADSTLFPLWNPNVFAGTPFLAESTNTQLLQPLHVLFAILPPGAAIAAVAPFYLALAGISMYAFLRVIKLPRGAALVGGITFMLASVATWWLILSYMQASVVWLLPLALIGAELILRGKYRWGMLLTSAALSLALFGHTQITFYILLTTGLYAVWMLTARWRREKLQSRALLARVGILAGSAFLALALAAIQLLPSLELTQLSHRAAVTDPTGIIPLPLSSLLTLILPGIAGFPPSGTSWGSTNPFDSHPLFGRASARIGFLGNMDTTKPLSRVGCSAHYRWSSVGPGLAKA